MLQTSYLFLVVSGRVTSPICYLLDKAVSSQGIVQRYGHFLQQESPLDIQWLLQLSY